MRKRRVQTLPGSTAKFLGAGRGILQSTPFDLFRRHDLRSLTEDRRVHLIGVLLPRRTMNHLTGTHVLHTTAPTVRRQRANRVDVDPGMSRPSRWYQL